MSNWWYRIQNPEIYQGINRTKNYFEGWYYKCVHSSGDHAFALIPGVSIESKNRRHAFIQLMDGTGGVSHYYEFDFEEFSFDPKNLEVRIGNNYFSTEKIDVDLPSLRGVLDISKTTPLRKRFWNPGIMGWYSFTPLMQCYHGIVSMHHMLNGRLEHDGREWIYDNAIGYIEKDWGTSFPKCWFWTQCNTFDGHEKLSVFASVAHIPWMGSYFIGYIAAIQIGDQLTRFATYNGAKYIAELDGDTAILNFKKGQTLLKVRSTKGIGADLKSPISGQMTGKVNESLTATMKVELIKNGKTIIIAEGRNAGLEIAGEHTVLLKHKF